MGYKLACGIAQSIMWNVLIYRDHASTDLNGAESMLDMTEAPGIVPLREGGFIALMYDSFMIVASETTVKRWGEHLVHNFPKFNILEKYLTIEKRSCKFSYCGIQIIQNGGRVSWAANETTAQKWLKAARNLSSITPRILFQFCGYLRHLATILGIPPRGLGRLIKCQSVLGEVENWDGIIFEQGEREDLLKTALRIIRANSTPRDCTMYRRCEHKRTFFAVVDATTTRWAVWPMKDGFPIKENVLEQECQLAIVLAEATAISKAISIAVRSGFANIIIASDNTAASRAFAKGFSKIEALDSIIRVHQYFHGRIVLADIASEMNLADIGTRPKKEYSRTEYDFRRTRTWEQLQTAWQIYKSYGTFLSRNK